MFNQNRIMIAKQIISPNTRHVAYDLRSIIDRRIYFDEVGERPSAAEWAFDEAIANSMFTGRARAF
jgi:hypothetical protein